MFRKFIHIVLFSLILATTTGIAVTKHFCNGILVSSELYGQDEACCDSQCCHNESQIVQYRCGFRVSELLERPSAAETELPDVACPIIAFFSPAVNIHPHPGIINAHPPGIMQRLSLMQSYLL